VESYVYRNYNDERAREYAQHGFSRRLKTLERCIQNVFTILPLDRVDIPASDELTDVAINLQAFIFNMFGSIDNLAWIWVCETNLVTRDGSPIPKEWIGLGKKNILVRKSFSSEFRGYLGRSDEWFDHLEDFRHALAHRIPLYVPPYTVTESKRSDYQGLESRISDALHCGSLDECERLQAEQDTFKDFWPVMTHSFVEDAATVLFHPQLLADFNTIEGLGRKMLEELDRQTSLSAQ
jgi:hypothetical protein